MYEWITLYIYCFDLGKTIFYQYQPRINDVGVSLLMNYLCTNNKRYFLKMFILSFWYLWHFTIIHHFSDSIHPRLRTYMTVLSKIKWHFNKATQHFFLQKDFIYLTFNMNCNSIYFCCYGLYLELIYRKSTNFSSK